MKKIILFVVATCATSLAYAKPSIDTLVTRGHLAKANGTQVSDGTYQIAFGVFQNGAAIWAQNSDVDVRGGNFSKDLNGLGSDLSSLSSQTGMDSDFSSITLNPSLLEGSSNGAIAIRAFAISKIDGTNFQIDLESPSVPTAFVAEIAHTANEISTTSKAATKISNLEQENAELRARIEAIEKTLK